jgi:hypothetical protein
MTPRGIHVNFPDIGVLARQALDDLVPNGRWLARQKLDRGLVKPL